MQANKLKKIGIILSLGIGLVLIIGGIKHQPDKPTVNHDQPSLIDPITNTYYVSMQHGLFTPNNLTIYIGESVTFINNDTENFQVASDNFEFDSGQIKPGTSAEIYFTDPGVYLYHNQFDKKMNGIISVEIPK